MSNKIHSDTHFTLQVKNLLNKIYGRSVLKDSMLERAINYFDSRPANNKKLDEFEQSITELTSNNTDGKNQHQIDKLDRECRDFQQDLKFESNERHQHLLTLCQEILALCEGENLDDTNRKSAQLLGTIQLLSPTEGSKVAEIHETYKPLYKTVLSLRLLDKLCIDHDRITGEPYIKEWLNKDLCQQYPSLKESNEQAYLAFTENVRIPLIMATLLQDIGHFHGESQRIVKGPNGELDPYRTLPVEERKALLQNNYRETVKYLVEGIGVPIYIGNSKAGRDSFNENERKKLLFIKHLLKSAIVPKHGIGNLLKVPQIYTSIILSTKSSYNYKLLPKVYQALNQNAERGTCNQKVVDALYAITGDFPQGFGVTYIPVDSDGNVGDHYEYAIVNRLYPLQKDAPHCRTATRNLTFMGYGQDIIIDTKSNLHHTQTAKAFASVSKDRLDEILQLLSSNYTERKNLDLLPRCWHAQEFFSLGSHQKLWNKNG